MIDRQNYADVQTYMDYSQHVARLKPTTLETRRWALKYLLTWADATLLGRAPAIKPDFPAFLEVARQDASPATRERICLIARLFFTWARDEYPKRYAACSAAWRASLRMPEIPSGAAHDHEVFDLAAVRQCIAFTPQTLREERDRAGVAFLFLSGMRVGAFTTLPIKAVDIPGRQVRQWPSLGVHTKLGKAATTNLLAIADLLEVVAAWDARVRPLGPECLWYAPISPQGIRLEAVQVQDASLKRRASVGKALQVLCDRAGLEYHSPHKLRHGHAVYAIGLARDIGDLKAISQNLMHTSVSTTDSIYGGFAARDLSSRIAGLGAGQGEAQIDALLDKLLSRLQQERG